ncbi:hypothetical protein GPECTOR_50g557 [Gonium pectorale]|uniref:Uncharacterized protein n=1 Tax=Gonium pectorale TaxID=33097 RepID=A0A150G7E8_GONPE|nr:hypothetical protein GPECTOR_50g557 [Gonium pectorale]|eukprot:KXZ45764.1 hypothetical protein GPECTOR_50g557 [Gonium pectorale]
MDLNPPGPVDSSKSRRASLVIKETGQLLDGLQADATRGETLMLELEALLASSKATSSFSHRALSQTATVTISTTHFAAVQPLHVPDDDDQQPDEASPAAAASIRPASLTEEGGPGGEGEVQSHPASRARGGRFMRALKGIFQHGQQQTVRSAPGAPALGGDTPAGAGAPWSTTASGRASSPSSVTGVSAVPASEAVPSAGGAASASRSGGMEALRERRQRATDTGDTSVAHRERSIDAGAGGMCAPPRRGRSFSNLVSPVAVQAVAAAKS